jgi:hypothetical protein
MRIQPYFLDLAAYEKFYLDGAQKAETPLKQLNTMDIPTK